MNPFKTIKTSNFSPEVYQPGFGNLTSEFATQVELQNYVAPDSFLDRYRGQSVVFPKNPNLAFEAFIEY